MKSIIIIFSATAILSFSAPKNVMAGKVQDRYAFAQSKEVNYQEITAAEIPEAVTKTIAKDYSGYAIGKAFKGDNGTFKVIVSKDKKEQVLIFNYKGEVIKVEVPNSKM